MPDMQKLRNSYYRVDYESPIGGITLCSDGNSLCGLWMEGQKYFGDTMVTYNFLRTLTAG